MIQKFKIGDEIYWHHIRSGTSSDCALEFKKLKGKKLTITGTDSEFYTGKCRGIGFAIYFDEAVSVEVKNWKKRLRR